MNCILYTISDFDNSYSRSWQALAMLGFACVCVCVRACVVEYPDHISCNRNCSTYSNTHTHTKRLLLGYWGHLSLVWKTFSRRVKLKICKQRKVFLLIVPKCMCCCCWLSLYPFFCLSLSHSLLYKNSSGTVSSADEKYC